MSHDGYTKVAVSSPEPLRSSPEVKPSAAIPLAAREYLNLPSSHRARRVRSKAPAGTSRRPGSKPVRRSTPRQPTGPNREPFHWRATVTAATVSTRASPSRAGAGPRSGVVVTTYTKGVYVVTTIQKVPIRTRSERISGAGGARAARDRRALKQRGHCAASSRARCSALSSRSTAARLSSS